MDGVSQGVLHLPLHPAQRSVVRMLIGPVLALNVADTVYTMGWIGTGLAVEGNPLMAVAFEAGPWAFALVKLSLVVLGLLLLDRLREHLMAQAATVLLFLVYTLVFLFHLDATGDLLI